MKMATQLFWARSILASRPNLLSTSFRHQSTSQSSNHDVQLGPNDLNPIEPDGDVNRYNEKIVSEKWSTRPSLDVGNHTDIYDFERELNDEDQLFGGAEGGKKSGHSDEQKPPGKLFEPPH